MSDRCAPNATRTAISCARCDTANESRPWNADRGEEERDDRECAEHAQLHRARLGLPVDDGRHRANVGDRHLGVGAPDDRADGRHQRRRIDRRMDEQIFGRIADQVAVGDLLVRQIHLRFARQLEAAHPDVRDHADQRSIVKSECEVSADRILTRHELLHERFADDGDELTIAGVALVENPPLPEANAERVEESRVT